MTNVYSMDLDNSGMIAGPLVFSVLLKVYGLLKHKQANVSNYTKAVINCLSQLLPGERAVRQLLLELDLIVFTISTYVKIRP